MTNPLILVIEDDKNISLGTRTMLELEGYRVYTAESLAESKTLTEKHKPDLTVLDILLPGSNGLDYCRMLRKQNASCF
ncbi:response regulator [Acidaminobacterium chupaoyuni]